jgi:threonine aldolase
MAKLLAAALARSKAIRLPLPTDANEVFGILPRRLHEALLKEGVQHYEWPGKGAGPGSLSQG